MNLIYTACLLTTTVGLLFAPAWTVAQTEIGTLPQKTIGQGKPELVPSLIVLNARGANLQGQQLTLVGVASNAIVFADRQVRAAGHVLTNHVLEEWGTRSDSLAKTPRNASDSVFSKDVASVRDVVVVLKTPTVSGEQVTFDVQVLEGELAGADGAAAVFIDIIGMPWTPLS